MRRGTSPLLCVGAALGCVCSTVITSDVLAQSTNLDSRGSESAVVADVTVRHRRLGSDGAPTGVELQPIRYRWERVHEPAGSRTVLTFKPPVDGTDSLRARRPQDARYEVARIEMDADGSAPKIYNRRGERIHLPDLKRLGLAGPSHLLPESARVAEESAPHGASLRPGRSSFDVLIASPGTLPARREALEQRFGRTKGKVGRLQRFLKTDGDETEELLVDPESGVPIEVNVVRQKQLVWHGRYTYARDAEGALVRRAAHVEQLLSDDGARLATDVEFANVRAVRGGRP